MIEPSRLWISCHQWRRHVLVINRVLIAVSFGALAWSCASCTGTAEGLSSVNGKLLCDGQPAAGATLFFHREAGGDAIPATVAGIIPSAVAQTDGSFTVESQPLGYGAAPGKYKVLVQWAKDSDLAQAHAVDQTKISYLKGKKVAVTKRNKLEPGAPDRLKGRYMNASQPLLRAEVKPGSNDLGTLEIKMTD